ncbi:hypothetical protein ACE0DR_02285 [Azotobacter sp. CWF10]
MPFGLEYAGVKGTDTEALMEYVEGRQEHNMKGGGAVDISSMSLPMQLFTYLFRPLPFEATTVFAMAAALDNMILLYLFVTGGRAMLRRPAGRRYQENRIFLWSYALVAWLMLAMTTANLGIALRQKWMFTPMLILLFLSALGTVRQQVRPASPPPSPVMQIYQRYGIRPGQRHEP